VKAARQWAIVIPRFRHVVIREEVWVIRVANFGDAWACITWRSRRRRAVREGVILGAICVGVYLSGVFGILGGFLGFVLFSGLEIFTGVSIVDVRVLLFIWCFVVRIGVQEPIGAVWQVTQSGLLLRTFARSLVQLNALKTNKSFQNRRLF